MQRADGLTCRRREMKNINTNKLWAYLEARFEEFEVEYDKQYEKARTSDNITPALCRMAGETEKRYFIVELKNEILSGKLNA